MSKKNYPNCECNYYGFITKKHGIELKTKLELF